MQTYERPSRLKVALFAVIICCGVVLLGGAAIAQEGAQKAQFKKVTEKLDRGGNLLVYMSTARMGDDLLDQLGSVRKVVTENLENADDSQRASRVFAFLRKLIRESGFMELGAVGFSSVRRSNNLYRNKMVLHRTAGDTPQTLWKAFGGEAHRMPGPPLFPANTVMASYNNMDFEVLWKWVNELVASSQLSPMQQGLQRMKMMARMSGFNLDKVMASTAGQWGAVVTVDESRSMRVPLGPGGGIQVPVAQGMVVLKVKNKNLFSRLSKIVKSNSATQHEQEGDLEMYVVPADVPLPLNVTVAQYGEYLIVASNDGVVRKAVQVAEGKAKGLRDTQQYAELTRGLPRKGVGFTYVSPRVKEVLQSVLQKAVQRRKSRGEPPVGKIMRTVMGADRPLKLCSVTRATDEGSITISNTTMSGANMVVKQAVVAPTAILGGMLLPAIGRARQEARKVACINNLKQIGTGIAMYRNENNGQMPPSLAELRETVLQSSKVFVCPATDKTKKVNGLKTGYKYLGPLPGEVPPMVIIAYDRKGNHSGGRNCLFRDFHVEFVKNQELRSGEGYESLEQSYEKVMKACGEDLTDERKKELQEFYEIE